MGCDMGQPQLLFETNEEGSSLKYEEVFFDFQLNILQEQACPEIEPISK